MAQQYLLHFRELTAIDLTIVCLATWRLAILLSDDSEGGPWDILSWLRYRLGVEYDDYGAAYGTNMISRMILCYKCNSYWIGLVNICLLPLVGDTLRFWLLPFAISGVVVIVTEILNR